MYKAISKFYDYIQGDIDYSKYALYFDKLIKRNKKDTKMVIDLGCGTGNLTVLLKKMGYDMTGLDISVEMLDKCHEKDKDILWIRQDICEMDLYGTYDVFVSFLDTINHITDKRKLKKAFKLVNLFLNDEGLFIFDINTPYKFEHIYKENIFYMIEDELTYIWENNYNRKNKICDMDITFFEKSGKNYKRYDDYHKEREYGIEELTSLAIEVGFEVIGVYKELTFKDITNKDERAFFVLKKVNK